jgi:hypothetical protein
MKSNLERSVAQPQLLSLERLSFVLPLLSVLYLANCRTPFPPPQATALRSPKADTVIHTGNVAFVWDSVPGVAYYQLQVDDRASFITPVFDTTGMPALTVEHFLPDGQYWWRVRARSRDSIWGDWSEAGSFLIRSYRIVAQIRTRGYPQGLEIKGNYAYVADGEAGLSIYDLSDSANFRLVSSIMDTTNSCWGVSVAGHYAYLAYGRKQLQIVDIARDDSLRMLGNISYTIGTGYDVQALDTQYVVVADHYKLSVFDVRDPNFPILLFEPHSTCRAVKVRDSVAYVACEQDGVQIMRISTGREPVTYSLLRTMGNARGLALAGNICYVADGRAGLTLVDIHDSLNPQILATCSIPGGYANKVAVHDSLAYVAAGAAGLAVINILDPTQPIFRAILKTPEAKALFVTPDGRVFLADRDWGLLLIEKEGEP